MMDEILEKAGLSYEELNAQERETLNTWMNTLSKNQMSLENVREYIGALKEAVEAELVNEPEFNYIFIFKVPNRKEILLKARLRNLMLIEAFLATPEKAQKALDRAVAGLVAQKR